MKPRYVPRVLPLEYHIIVKFVPEEGQVREEHFILKQEQLAIEDKYVRRTISHTKRSEQQGEDLEKKTRD